MPHITLPDALPGIRGPMAFSPETAGPLNDLADVLLRGPSTLSMGERELIATFVSTRNDCRYCQTIHGAIAAHHLGDEDLVVQVKGDPARAPISEKLKALLVVAGQTAQGGTFVTPEAIARGEGPRRDRPRDPRHRAHRRVLLSVQPLRRRPRDLGSGRSGVLSCARRHRRRARLSRRHTAATTCGVTSVSAGSESRPCPPPLEPPRTRAPELHTCPRRSSPRYSCTCWPRRPRRRIPPGPSKAVSPTTPPPPCRARWSSPRRWTPASPRKWSAARTDSSGCRCCRSVATACGWKRRSSHPRSATASRSASARPSGCRCNSNWPRSPRRSPSKAARRWWIHRPTCWAAW